MLKRKTNVVNKNRKLKFNPNENHNGLFVKIEHNLVFRVEKHRITIRNRWIFVSFYFVWILTVYSKMKIKMVLFCIKKHFSHLVISHSSASNFWYKCSIVWLQFFCNCWRHVLIQCSALVSVCEWIYGKFCFLLCLLSAETCNNFFSFKPFSF